MEKLEPATGPVQFPEVMDFGVFDLLRSSSNKNESGRMVGPFAKAEVIVSLGVEPKTAEKVTVVPLGTNVDPFQLTIRSSEKKEEPCSDTDKKVFWDVETEPITAKEILEAQALAGRADEFPFDAAVIYPSVPFAKAIESGKLTAEMLPQGVPPSVVEAAIDLDNDQKPDLLQTTFCCSKPGQKPDPESDCMMCSKTYKKTNGKWTVINSATPC